MFTAFVYYLSAPFLYILSWLPFSLLYFVSDVCYFIGYRLVGYRRSVVRANLKNAFPEKSETEINEIQDRFYRHFFDLMLETLKTLSITEKEILNRVSFHDQEVLAPFYHKGQSVIIVIGHFGNWEFGGLRFSLNPYHHLFSIYRPLKNQYFDRLIAKMRSRFGSGLYPMKTALRGMIRNRDQVTATTFLADQSPPPDAAYWTSFLNQDTPVFNGTAKISRKLGYPVVYIAVHKEKRGRYRMTAEVLIEDPSTMTADEITELHTRRLEKDIIRQPEVWLWSHRRWKHRRPEVLEDAG